MYQYIPFTPTQAEIDARKALWAEARLRDRLFNLGYKHQRLGKAPQRQEVDYLKGYRFRYYSPFLNEGK